MKWIFVIFLVFVSGCTLDYSDRAFEFLKNSYENCEYEDEYLTYVYPSENLGEINDCKITYRKIDAFYNIINLNSEIIEKQKEDANSVFNNLDWNDSKIFNTLRSDNGGVALDTYCIVAYQNRNEKMVDNFVSYLSNNNWIKDNYFSEDTWRNIADETWCIRAMTNVNYDQELIDDLIDIKIQETSDYYENDIFRSAVLYHMIYLILDYEDVYGRKYESVKNSYINELFSLLENNDNLLMKANILEILSKSGYNKGILFKYYNEIKNMQNQDGSWGENAKVFTTLRVLTGLKEYEA